VTLGTTPETSSVVTVVVRAWVASPPTQPRVLRYQATHIQTGQVNYFETFDGVARYVDRLSERLVPRAQPEPPIDLSQWRRT
jgi:hypothetical protein